MNRRVIYQEKPIHRFTCLLFNLQSHLPTGALAAWNYVRRSRNYDFSSEKSITEDRDRASYRNFREASDHLRKQDLRSAFRLYGKRDSVNTMEEKFSDYRPSRLHILRQRRGWPILSLYSEELRDTRGDFESC